MNSLTAPRPAIGVWLEWPVGGSFVAQGMSRLLGFLIEGAAQCGCCTFRVAVPSAVAADADRFLRSLKATEGVDWTLHAPPPPEEQPRPTEAPVPPAPAWARRLRPRTAGVLLAAAGLALLPLALLRSLVRPILRPLWQRLAMLVRIARDPVNGVTEVAAWLRRLPFRIGAHPARLLELWRLDQLAPQPAEMEGQPCETEKPIYDPALIDPASAKLALTLGRLPVDGWLIFFPNYSAATLLPGPRAVLFPDAMPFDFPHGWRDAEWQLGGTWHRWLQRTRLLLDQGDPIITFSHHVARRHVGGIFGVSPERCHVIPLAPPDLAPLLPGVVPCMAATPDSRAAAAATSRQHAAKRGWTYLRDFPFEETAFVVVSTQDRPNKNLRIVIEALLRLLRRDLVSLKLVVTATPDPAEGFGRQIREAGLEHDVIAMPDLPAPEHAALFHCAALAVHPAVFEGIGMPLPFSEAISVGTPCLVAQGPHVAEGRAEHDVAEDIFDPYDAQDLARRILRVMNNREATLHRQRQVYAALARNTWARVATAYTAVTLHRPGMRGTVQ